MLSSHFFFKIWKEGEDPFSFISFSNTFVKLSGDDWKLLDLFG